MRPEARTRRTTWVAELAILDGSFGEETIRVLADLRAELAGNGFDALRDHLRFCGTVPESYGHDSSAEKLYAKYTDAVVSEAFSSIGLQSTLIMARADVADVQARAVDFSLVADAKAFRLSRTAKNQKDFKVQAMDGWRNGLDYALLVCPIYHLPTRNSQVYQQAIARNVCILSYAYLATLVSLAEVVDTSAATRGLHAILRSVSLLHPSKSAVDYWAGINRSLLDSLHGLTELWTTEKTASLEALDLLKQEAFHHLTAERNRLLGLSHVEALAELMRQTGIDARMIQVSRVTHSELLGV